MNLSKPRLRAARRTLEDAGLLRLAGKHRAGSRPQTFVLTRMHPNLSEAESLPTLNAKAGVKAGGGSSITYDARFQTYKSGGQNDG
jgi:hypothetical protein